jgi:hypothetical protein
MFIISLFVENWLNLTPTCPQINQNLFLVSYGLNVLFPVPVVVEEAPGDSVGMME